MGKPLKMPENSKATDLASDETSAQNAAGVLQTLDRGLLALAAISRHPDGLSVADLAIELDVHRAIAYRLVATLDMHRVIARGVDGQYRLGAGLLTLASRFQQQLRSMAQPLLAQLAEATQAAAFISMAQGQDCVAILVAEPEGSLFHSGYKVGSRHPLTKGAAGIAILANRSEKTSDPLTVREARRLGYSVTRGDVVPGVVGIATAIRPADADHVGFEASIGVVAFENLQIDKTAALVIQSAKQLLKSFRTI